MGDDAPIAVMDGTCALCSFAARVIHRLDRAGTIRICPIQTARGQALLQAHGLDALDPDSWLFIADGRAWRDFDALIRLGGFTGGWGRVFALLRLIPPRPRSALYRSIARNRYRLFGRADLCALPDPGLQARLLS